MRLNLCNLLAIFLCLSSCGGHSSGSKSSSSASVHSSVLSSSLSSSSSSITLPADFPTGTVENLPTLSISTDNGVAIDSKENYVDATYTLSGEGVELIEGGLEIRGRGNSTWGWPKKPYRLKLTSSTSLLGMPASKHWVLLANYADKTLIRNDITFMFSRSIGMEYTTRAQHIELNLNGVYQGVYQLVEHIRVDDDRVNIPELEVTDTDAENVSGGYLMEIDFRMSEDYCIGNTWEPYCVNDVNTQRDIDFCIDSNHGMDPFCIDTPDTLHDPEWSVQRNYIENYIAETETALFGENFSDPETGYAAFLDVDSTIDYYLINELFKNVDGASASVYLYKKRNGKLFFGPVWDFDLALGNAGYNDVDKTYGWHIRKASWFSRLFEDPAFEAKTKARWQELKAEGKLELIFLYAEARATWLDKAQERNFNLWQIFDWETWYTRIIMGSYDLELEEMIRWQRERYEWMDEQLSD